MGQKYVFSAALVLPRFLLNRLNRRIERVIVRDEPCQAMLDWADRMLRPALRGALLLSQASPRKAAYSTSRRAAFRNGKKTAFVKQRGLGGSR